MSSRGMYGRTGGKDIAVDAKHLKPFMAASGGDTYRVRVSADDTTPNYLEQKTASADTSVVITVTNPGADEGLDFSVAVYVTGEIATHASDPDAHHNQSHVLATTAGLGADHTTSGLTAGMVLQATSATAAAFAFLDHDDLTNVTADQHHSQSHVLATTAGLGADHTTSGLTAGMVLRATSATTAAFASLQATDLPAHVLATNLALGSQHTISGASAGDVLRASSATAANFQPLTHSDLSGVGANDHHNQVHGIVSSDHTVTGSTLDVVGLSAANTLAILTPSEAVSTATAALLRTDSNGRFRAQGFSIGESSTYDALQITKNSAGSPAVIITASSNGEMATPDGEFWRMGHWNSGTTTFTERFTMDDNGAIYIGETANGDITVGLTINMGDNTGGDHIVSYKSSNVAVGITTRVETDTFGFHKKHSETAGGLQTVGVTEDTIGLSLVGWVTNEDTSKNASSNGAIILQGATKSGTDIADMGAGSNVVVFKDRGNTLGILAQDGDLYLDTALNQNHWDREIDIALLNGLRAAMMPPEHALRQRFAEFAEYARPILESTRVMRFNDDGHHFMGVKGSIMLVIDTVRQMYEQMDYRIGALERRLLN